MRATGRWLLSVGVIAVVLTAALAQAGGGGGFTRHRSHLIHHLHRGHIGKRRFSHGHHRRHRFFQHGRPHHSHAWPHGQHSSHIRYSPRHGRPAPPYSGSIGGELARLYRSSPQVSVHYGDAAPVWTEYHFERHAAAPQTMLHIAIALSTGDVSLDGRHLGQAGEWPQGRVRVPISPGSHIVQLRLNGNVYSRQVQVYEGMATVIKAGRR